MSNQDEAARPPVIVPYGPPLRATIAQGNLTTMKAALADAEALHKQQGDIRSAVALARIALAAGKASA
jgi:hypothetical protein